MASSTRRPPIHLCLLLLTALPGWSGLRAESLVMVARAETRATSGPVQPIMMVGPLFAESWSDYFSWKAISKRFSKNKITRERVIQISVVVMLLALFLILKN